MAEERFGDRTEQATPRRKQEAREMGNVAKSIDLSTALVLLAGTIAVYTFSGNIYSAFTTLYRESLHYLETGDENSLLPFMFKSAKTSGLALAPILAVIIVTAIVSKIMQFGFIFSPQLLEIDIDRINPISGFTRFFSLRSVVRFIMGSAKLALIGTVLYLVLKNETINILNLTDMTFNQITFYFFKLVYKVALITSILLLILGLLDFGYQKFQHERSLMMSKEEVKEEMKRYEIDPKIKEKRKQLFRQIAYKRMLQKVPKATVVITNPTEIAVAIKYDQDKDSAPVVVAKGQLHLAAKIRSIANENNIPVIERKEVARALYKQCEIDDPIPETLYKACAEVLAYVYMMKQKFARSLVNSTLGEL